jgi:ABC-2 type transport system permease protein
MRAIALLSLWQIKNAVRSSFTDIRKLIPLLFLGFVLVSQAFSLAIMIAVRPAFPTDASSMLAPHVELVQAGVFLFLVLITIGLVDYGFSGGFLTFTLADIDYLFPAPISRRTVLAYRLGAKTGMAFLQSAFLIYFLFFITPARLSLPAAGVAVAALFLCIGGYTNLALALKLVFGFGNFATARRWIAALLVLAGLSLFLAYRVYGIAVLTEAGRNWLAVTLFYPCRLAAVAVAAPLGGRIDTGGIPLLALFYVLTLALVLSRKENFYDASLEVSERSARLMQAAREQNWAAMFSMQREAGASPRRARARARPYTVPPFGRGGGALLWAHISAAAKRPFVNFWGPLLGGVAISLAASTWLPRVASFFVGSVVCYLLFILTMSGVVTFRQSLQRQTLIRPLPIPGWQAVAADVGPRILISCLGGWGAGFTLLLLQPPYASQVALILIVCLPFVLASLNLIQYVVALWFPDAQDKLQQLLSGFVTLGLTGFLVGFLAPFVGVPLWFRLSGWVTALIFMIPAAALAALLLLLAAYAYRRFQPR